MHNKKRTVTYSTAQYFDILSYILYILYREPHGRHCTRGASDLGQGISDLLVFVSLEKPGTMSGPCKGRCWKAPCQPVLCAGGCYQREPSSLSEEYIWVCFHTR